MFRTLAIATMLLIGASASANAACPSIATDSTADTIKANELRIICLQQEAAASATRQKYQMDLNALQRQIDSMQLQQRLDSVQPFQLPTPYVPPPFMQRQL